MSAAALDQRGADTTLADMHRHVSKGRAMLAELAGGFIEVESAGNRVYDANGQEFLDCAGFGVFILGHRHPRVVEAVQRQLERHPLATRMLAERRLPEAARTLAAVAPGDLDYVHFVTSGAEAVETAIKIARTHGKHRLISTGNSYHGKTLGALSLTAQAAYQDPFRPLIPGVTHVPFDDCDSLERALARSAGQSDCCVILEPVQSEGGVIIPQDGYLADAQALCRSYGALLVLDEIQTGLGRLGSWWGADRDGVVPDVLLAGKSLSGGVVPVAAAISSARIYEPLSREPFLHTSTFAGAPIAMAAAQAAVETIAEEGIVERAHELGITLLDQLRAIADGYPPELIEAVRGRGLLIGIEFAGEHLAGDFMLEMLARRVITNHSLNAHRVIRLTPAATLTPPEVSWLVDAADTSLQALAARYCT